LIQHHTVILAEGDVLIIGTQRFIYHHTVGNRGHHNDSSTQSERSTDWTDLRVGDRFIIKGTSLGSGAFSVVQLAVDQMQHKQVACKIVKRKRLESDALLEREVGLMKGLDHVCSPFMPTVSNTKCTSDLAWYQQIRSRRS